MRIKLMAGCVKKSSSPISRSRNRIPPRILMPGLDNGATFKATISTLWSQSGKIYEYRECMDTE